MQPARRLYERADSASRPLWHLDGGRTCFIGPLTYNAPHQHGAPVFLAGIYGDFLLRVAGHEWRSCRTAVIPAGVVHELDVGGDPIAVLYIEPTVDGQHALAALIADGSSEEGALIGSAGEILPFREMWEDAASPSWAAEGLDSLLTFASAHARRRIDARIACSIELIGASSEQRWNIEMVAARAGLSSYRFQHLFSQEVGVPYRRYRAWMRMRDAIAAVATGESLTGAAHDAGFFDQAHFTHDFRRTFGAPPSWSLSGIRMSGEQRGERPESR